jgi:hypothetical protein
MASPRCNPRCALFAAAIVVSAGCSTSGAITTSAPVINGSLAAQSLQAPKTAAYKFRRDILIQNAKNHHVRPSVYARNFSWVQVQGNANANCASGWYTVSGGVSYSVQQPSGQQPMPNTGSPNLTHTKWSSSPAVQGQWSAYASCVVSGTYNNDFEWVSGSATAGYGKTATAIATCDSGYQPVSGWTNLGAPAVSEFQPSYGGENFKVVWNNYNGYESKGSVYASCVKSSTGVQVEEVDGTGSAQAGCGTFGSNYIIVGGTTTNDGSPNVVSEYPTITGGHQRWDVFLDRDYTGESVTAIASCLPTSPPGH